MYDVQQERQADGAALVMGSLIGLMGVLALGAALWSLQQGDSESSMGARGALKLLVFGVTMMLGGAGTAARGMAS